MEDPDVLVIQDLGKKGDFQTPISRRRKNRRTPDVQFIQNLEEDKDLWMSFHGDGKDPIPVERYFDDLQFQKAILASLVSPSKTQKVINLSDEEEEERPIVQYHRSRQKRKPSINLSVTESGQSSNSEPTPKLEQVFCPICMESKSPNESFTMKNCSHIFCIYCMRKYVASKIQENMAKIACPDTNCNAELEPGFCKSILQKDVFERWGNVLCESVILGATKIYCPFKDCSALLLDESGEDSVVTESECPHCRRLFCAQCEVPWHTGVDCEEFQKLGKDEREREDIMLIDLAKKSNWKRCLRCRFYVERTEGCLLMKCRCGFSFCFNCGAPMKEHYCSNCKH